MKTKLNKLTAFMAVMLGITGIYLVCYAIEVGSLQALLWSVIAFAITLLLGNFTELPHEDDIEI